MKTELKTKKIKPVNENSNQQDKNTNKVSQPIKTHGENEKKIIVC